MDPTCPAVRKVRGTVEPGRSRDVVVEAIDVAHTADAVVGSR
jgi:hypothetical protein